MPGTIKDGVGNSSSNNSDCPVGDRAERRRVTYRIVQGDEYSDRRRPRSYSGDNTKRERTASMQPPA